jgi:hypothetical protein
MKLYHKTKDGKKIKLTDLELDHLKNIINWIESKAEKGLKVSFGSSGSYAEDMSYDEDVYYGEEVKSCLNYNAYKDELKRRLINFKTKERQTAVEYLLEHCEIENWNIPFDVEHTAKKIEKEQRMWAWCNGYKSYDEDISGDSPLEYYNETFNTK